MCQSNLLIRYCNMLITFLVFSGHNVVTFNALVCKGNYSSNRIIRSWYTGRWWVGYYIWYSEEGAGQGGNLSSPILAVPNVTAHPTHQRPVYQSTLYDGLMLCGFNAPIKALITNVAQELKMSCFNCLCASTMCPKKWMCQWSSASARQCRVSVLCNVR